MLSTIHGCAAVLYYKIGTIQCFIFFFVLYYRKCKCNTLKSIINLNNYNSIRYRKYSIPFQMKLMSTPTNARPPPIWLLFFTFQLFSINLHIFIFASWFSSWFWFLVAAYVKEKGLTVQNQKLMNMCLMMMQMLTLNTRMVIIQ